MLVGVSVLLIIVTFLTLSEMTTTSFYKGVSYSKFDAYYEDREHDDYMSAEDYEEREYYRNGWNEEQTTRQRF